MENKIFNIQSIKKLIESKEVDTLLECIPNIELDESPIGEGGNAFIYIPKNESWRNACVKKIKTIQQIVCNDIEKEHELQEKLRERGVRTPLSIAFLKTEDGNYLIMERINGHNVKEISENPSLMPESFDYRIFCDSLDEQIAKMHNKGKMEDGIYHRDLHERNVMINEEGLPVIIDFGTAVEGSGSDFTYEEGVTMYNGKKEKYEFVTGYFKDDLEMVKNIKSALKIFIKK